MDSTDNTPTVAIVGQGNVASHLLRAFRDKAKIIHANSHTLEGLQPDCNFIIVSVKDDAIPSVVEEINGRMAEMLQKRSSDKVASLPVIAHTSGSTPLSALDAYPGQKGVFYPLQTFSANDSLRYKEIPFFIEGSDNATSERLAALASMISDNVHMADSSVRKELHIAAVFACNYTNHLISIADRLLHKSGLDYKVLLPLIRQSIGKLERMSPHEAQTGPAVRGDRNTMEEHLSMLSTSPELSAIYGLLAESIKHEYSPD